MTRESRRSTTMQPDPRRANYNYGLVQTASTKLAQPKSQIAPHCFLYFNSFHSFPTQLRLKVMSEGNPCNSRVGKCLYPVLWSSNNLKTWLRRWMERKDTSTKTQSLWGIWGFLVLSLCFHLFLCVCLYVFLCMSAIPGRESQMWLLFV